MSLRIGSLFSGVGMLDVAVASVLGGRVAWHVENDRYAARVLDHHWPDTPNHADVTAVDWRTPEPVDVLTGGWPCQPFSHAGKRLGAADARALWPYVARAVRALRPRLVVLENVTAIASAGELARATADLAAVGYVGSWRCVSASDVGAPHGRSRIFIAASPAARPAPDPRGEALRLGTGLRASDPLRERRGRPDHDAVAAPPDPDGDGLPRLGGQHTREGDPHRRGSEDIAWGKYEPAIRRWETILGRPAPAPTEPTGRHGAARLSPALTEWMMGWPAGWVTDPAIWDGFTVKGKPATPPAVRNAQLRMCGNGVVPQQAAHALRLILGQQPNGGAASVPRLLPTPAVNDMGEGKTLHTWDEWTERMRAQHGNGNGHGQSLAIAAKLATEGLA